MTDRDSILVMGVAFEKATQRSAAKKVYKRYIMTSDFFLDYQKIIGKHNVENEIESIQKIEDVVKLDKHIVTASRLYKTIPFVKTKLNFTFKNATNVAYLYEYLITTDDHSKDTLMIEKYLGI